MEWIKHIIDEETLYKLFINHQKYCILCQNSDVTTKDAETIARKAKLVESIMSLEVVSDYNYRSINDEIELIKHLNRKDHERKSK